AELAILFGKEPNNRTFKSKVEVVPQNFALNTRGLAVATRSEEHTSELQSRENLVCRLLLEKKNSLCIAGARASCSRGTARYPAERHSSRARPRRAALRGSVYWIAV